MSKDLQNMKFKFKTYHPGIGKTQRKILDILEEQSKSWEFVPLDDLTAMVYHPDLRGATIWMEENYPTTRSQINTVRRAVKALKKRGLVKKEVFPN